MIRDRRARIVATLGPASRDPAMVRALAEAGADMFRLNFSHGSHADHAANAQAVRAAEAALRRPFAILADLQGPKLRLGRFAEGEASLREGELFRLELDGPWGDSRRALLPHPEAFAALTPGALILIDDGRVRLRVEQCGVDFVETRVLTGGTVSDRKGVNLPDRVLSISPMTEKDYADLAFALDLGVDWVALSFVQRPSDMAELKRLVAGRAACLAKIEKPAALANLAELLDHCDGLMVARGDLGVELDPEEVPVAQKVIIRAARARGLPVIVATQMLDSMVNSPAPTRAEASDVASAVYEGADALMLSAESASGRYPREAVAMMSRIISRTERDPRWPMLMDAEHPDIGGHDAMAAAARAAAEAARPACFVAYTETGATARRLSRERPLQPILALTPHLAMARRMALGWGLEPRVMPPQCDLESVTEAATAAVTVLGLARAGDRVIILAGVPFGAPGATNLLRLAYAAPTH